jgi:hypothetical protein
LFSTAPFQEWRARTDLLTHNGVLWIKGKPGAGKSTLMKHALGYCQKIFDNHLIVSYFFNARGAKLDKERVGMLRSIVYQLIYKDDVLYERFRPIYEKQMMFKKGQRQWTDGQLEHFIRSMIDNWQSKPLLLLIDALDECNNQSVRDVVSFLETLSIAAVEAGVTLRICLSSRHYPNVSMRKTLELIVEASGEHERDIATYIAQKLGGRDDFLNARVREKAGGIFMWVVIVVSLLNKACGDGELETIRGVLEQVPADLEGVFDRLLGNDPYKTETIRMLQWVLLGSRPLQPKELFFAALPETALEYFPPSERSKVTTDIIQRRITASSKGLIETRTGETSSVQFIHLSVKDFLLRNRRLQTLDQTLEPDPISASHGQLWERCWSEIRHQDTTSLVEIGDMELLKDNYPFLHYATECIFDHAEKALAGGAKREGIIQWLQTGIHWFEWWKKFVKTDKLHFIQSMAAVDVDENLIYTLSYHGHRHLVAVVLARGDTDVNALSAGFFNTALEAASVEGHDEVVQQLLDHGADVNAQGGPYGNALQAASRFGYSETVQKLLDHGADVNARGGFFGTALEAASVEGYDEVVQKLLDHGADVNAQGGLYGTALEAASVEGHDEVVQKLLDHGADVNAQGRRYSNALEAASARGHDTIV